MKIYEFNTLTTGVLRDGMHSVLVQNSKATIDETNPALVALAKRHGGRPEKSVPKTKDLSKPKAVPKARGNN